MVLCFWWIDILQIFGEVVKGMISLLLEDGFDALWLCYSCWIPGEIQILRSWGSHESLTVPSFVLFFFFYFFPYLFCFSPKGELILLFMLKIRIIPKLLSSFSLWTNFTAVLPHLLLYESSWVFITSYNVERWSE